MVPCTGQQDHPDSSLACLAKEPQWLGLKPTVLFLGLTSSGLATILLAIKSSWSRCLCHGISTSPSGWFRFSSYFSLPR